MRRYDDPVEVRRGEVAGIEAPAQFLWRGRLWQVRAVTAHWVETGAWWRSAPARAALGHSLVEEEAAVPAGDLLEECQVWRVEAWGGRARSGVFELRLDQREGSWRLVGCAD
ncbi:DUF6504 family protein [Nocardioides insulae]|uniref:DUF6504 family protein n=1 Tax=Nocardioides insulae TaxID=394734 RepID=UPI00040D68D2|nr:DUF6504 family protein [Nocardioides insulae]